VKTRLFDLLIGGLAGFVLAAGLSTLCYDQSVRRLQDYSHQVARSSATITLHIRARADTLRRRADSIAATRRTVIARVEQDTVSAALANRALQNARTVRDTNVALRLENQALRQAVGGLWVALQQSNQIIALERARGDSLDHALGQVNRQLQGLAARVEQLKPAPKLLRISWEVAKLGGAVYGGYQLGRHHP
jgi:hypothetical protein